MAAHATAGEQPAPARRPLISYLTRWARPLGDAAAGALAAPVELLFLLLAGLALVAVAPLPPARRAAGAAIIRYARRLAQWERRRLGLHPNAPDAASDVPGPRLLGYLAARLLPGILGALGIGLLGVGGVLAFIVLRSVVAGDTGLPDLLVQTVVGAALLLVNLQAIASVAALDRRLAHAFLAPSPRDVLERRVGELAASRAGVIAAVDAERQRIERDLHDGVQQRLVALGMLLGRARRSRDTDKMRTLLNQAHQDAQRAIDDLREVAWRVYPSVLDHAGLDDALAMVAQRSAVPVKIVYEQPVRPARHIETVLYFVACEAITNAAKHSSASLITVEISAGDPGVEMRVRDDGVGGADPSGSGLHGLARRVAALDGRFRVDSPPGGPTTVVAELPCA